MPSSFTKLLADYFYGVVGILRKRARYRCEKRGEDFDKYEEKVSIEQRAIGKPLFEERMKMEVQKPNWFSCIEKDTSWQGASFIVPMFFPKRKRSQHRRKQL